MVERHEFWLSDSSNKNTGIYRIALGSLIKASERKTIPPFELDARYHTLNGSVGFVDVTVRNEFVPRQGANPIPNPGCDPYWDNRFDSSDYETVKALVVFDMGIEPGYRQLKHFLTLKRRIEKLTKELRLPAVVAVMIENDKLRKLMPKGGWVLYDGGVNAIKWVDITHP